MQRQEVEALLKSCIEGHGPNEDLLKLSRSWLTLERQRDGLLAALKARTKNDVQIGPLAVHPSKQFCKVCGLNDERAVHSNGCPVLLCEAAIASVEGSEGSQDA